MQKRIGRKRRHIIGETIFAFFISSVFTAALALRMAPSEPLQMPAPAHAVQERVTLVSWQLPRLRTDAAACANALARTALTTTPLANRRERGFCGYTNAVTLERANYSYSSPAAVSCPVAAALDVWEREVVAAAAAAHLASPIVEIVHMGAYNCRRVYGRAHGRVSEHASANAIDIAGFRLADGRQITVTNDFRAQTPEGAFLRQVRDRSCGVFSTVLSPDYNAAHRDHLHLDMGALRLCR